MVFFVSVIVVVDGGVVDAVAVGAVVLSELLRLG